VAIGREHPAAARGIREGAEDRLGTGQGQPENDR
jgi:hypothetical protein